jgi:hypothetical protein
MKRQTRHSARRRLCLETLESRNLLCSTCSLPLPLEGQQVYSPEGESAHERIVDRMWTGGYGFDVADGSRPRPRDINGDGRPDAFFATIFSDDFGNKVELWGIDRSWFATLYNGQYLVGRCPYASGENFWRLQYVEDLNSGTKRLLSVTHTSRESRDERGNFLWWGGFNAVRGLERIEFTLDVPNHELTITQLTRSGSVIKRDVQCPRLATGNQAPVAVAGTGQQHLAQHENGFVTVTLDGSASWDPDGHIRSYEWTQGNRVLGNTPILTTNFSVGWHEVTLTVTDCGARRQSDRVIINVRPPLPTPVQVRLDQPYVQDFSSGIPGASQGWELHSTHEGRIAVVNGRLRMDDRVNNRTFSQNEAILHVDLLGQSNVQLSGRHWRVRGEVAYAGDGIAISADGLTWHPVTAFNPASTGAFRVDLDAAVAAAGISYTSQFQIKFQQYGNAPAPRNGREWDDIKVERVPPPTPQLVRMNQPYFQDFSSGLPGRLQGWEFLSTNDGRIAVVDGRLRMDANGRTFSQNEAILHVNLLGQSNVQLSGSHWRVRGEVAYAGDGIAISADGVRWYPVTAFNRALTGPFVVDLDAAVAAAGISYTSQFQIKFQQYGNAPAPNNGRAWDDIRVELVAPI